VRIKLFITDEKPLPGGTRVFVGQKHILHSPSEHILLSVFNKEAPLNLAEVEEKRSLNFVLILFFVAQLTFCFAPFDFSLFWFNSFSISCLNPEKLMLRLAASTCSAAENFFPLLPVILSSVTFSPFANLCFCSSDKVTPLTQLAQ